MTAPLLSPPTAPPAADPAPASAAPRVVSLVTAIIGGLIVLVFVAGAAFLGWVRVAQPFGGGPASYRADVASVSKLQISAPLSDLTVRFVPGSEAVLNTEGFGSAAWTLENRGDTLVVGGGNRQGFSGRCFGLCLDSSRGAVLTLPQSLAGKLDATITVNAGSVEVHGDLRDLVLTVGGGTASVEGAVRSADVTVGAGDVDLALRNTSSAKLVVRAGSLSAQLAGIRPTTVSARVDAGSMDVTLPEGSYAVTQRAAMGDLDNRLRVDSASSSRVELAVNMGSLTIR